MAIDEHAAEEVPAEDHGADPPRSRRLLGFLIGLLVVIAVGIQFVPYGWGHTNPPVVEDAPWPDAASAEIARTSCYSCHSNETDWPAYSYVAPMSWLVRSDVEAGREELNFSDWGRFAGEVDDAIKAIEADEMPPTRYTMVHRDAALTADESRLLVDALRQMSGEDDD